MSRCVAWVGFGQLFSLLKYNYISDYNEACGLVVQRTVEALEF